MAKGKFGEWLTDEGLLKLEGWARDGLTDEQIAHNIQIRRETLYEWKKKYPNISNALKKGKEVVDREVENALLKRALGHTVTDTQYRMVKVDATVLSARRSQYMNEYKLDHPEDTKQEIAMAAALAVPTWEKIPIAKTEREVPPDIAAITFWLKNRKPEEYREKSYQELNKAQTEKAVSDAKRADIETQIKEQELENVKNGATSNMTINITKWGEDDGSDVESTKDGG